MGGERSIIVVVMVEVVVNLVIVVVVVVFFILGVGLRQDRSGHSKSRCEEDVNMIRKTSCKWTQVGAIGPYQLIRKHEKVCWYGTFEGLNSRGCNRPFSLLRSSVPPGSLTTRLTPRI